MVLPAVPSLEQVVGLVADLRARCPPFWFVGSNPCACISIPLYHGSKNASLRPARAPLVWRRNERRFPHPTTTGRRRSGPKNSHSLVPHLIAPPSLAPP